MQTLAKAVFNDKNLSLLPLYVDGGSLPALIVGPGEGARAQIAAGLHLREERPLFVVCADDSSAQRFARDLELFTGERCYKLLARDLNLYAAEGASRENERGRIEALCALAGGKAELCVASVSGLMERTAPPKALLSAGFVIETGRPCPPEEAERALLRCGYQRTEQVEGMGQFSRRGGILDFFSPGAEAPVRCEFWGDDVDSMGHFDSDSQRRTDVLERCEILPSREVLPALGSDLFADELYRLIKQTEKKGGEKLSETLRNDAERLTEELGFETADRYIALIYPEFHTAADYISPETLVFLDRPGRLGENADSFMKQHTEDVKLLMESGIISGRLAQFFMPWEQMSGILADFALVMADAFTAGRYAVEPKSIVNCLVKQLPSYGGSSETAAEDVLRYTSEKFAVVVLAADKRRAELLCDYLLKKGVKTALDTELKALPKPGSCVVSVGALSAGFEYPDAKLAVITDSQIIGSGIRKAKRKKALKDRQGIDSCADLSVGDLVVHEIHGIGRFAGIFKMPVDGVEKDYIKLCYAGTDSLYVPATQLDMVSKYIGGGGEDRAVRLSKLGGGDWEKAKKRTRAAVKEMAKELIKLYAERQRQVGFAFSPDSEWQTEFEENFEYTETDDQLRCIREIKEDMETPRPMDRLLCGDVGYGKTEVALRAVMKCILDGKQAAILVPTTVLAQQHYQTAVQRFFGFPVTIELLNRYRSPAQVKQTLKGIKDGSADLVIGTHRLLQKDIEFKNLGLLVVDEEQRFGVTHKERLKEMCSQVDSLTLSATPIPRTLNMALSGLRDMSTIEEPPQERQPVQTYVMEHDWGVVCDAIRREVLRGGQVYYLHNRVESIERTASRLAKMLEDVSVSVAHGQMEEEELSAAMESMVSGETQVLVCTTIIETGIDIPNVNTLIIEDADRLGLAQLHQLRGRVGRSARRASAYLTFRRDKVLTEVAEKRLSAIREFAEFNSGFKIAMRDLEIRGAGNLLGAEQSGHLTDVGYDLYLKLLEEAVLEEKGEKPPVRTECSADLSVSANIPESYVRSSEQRMDIYRRIAMIRTEEEADDLTDELIDRFGDPPASVNALVHVALLRGEAETAGITEISQKSGSMMFGLSEFNMAAVSALCGQKDYKGKLRVDAASKPRLILTLCPGGRTIEQARRFVAAYRGAMTECREGEGS